MAVILALVTSALWGTGDFFGGLATKRQSVFRVMLWVHALGLVGIAAVAPLLAEEIIGRDLAIGAVAGVVGLVGLLLLYWSLAVGPMAVVAPVSALVSALLPVLWGLREDAGAFTATEMAGLAVGLVAVVAISWHRGVTDAVQPSARVLGAAVVAGVCFGSLILLYDATDEASAPWPIVSGRVLTTILLLVVALAGRRSLTPGGTLGYAAAAGFGDTFANAALLVATSIAESSAELAVVAVLAAFYPATTIAWARIVLDEPVGRIRLGGLVLGFAAIALMTLG